ncbi:SDR family NAD(P)-dependent oxidoreductase [Actinoplanes sp. NPDC049596]|uniref:SDR family NAD(P)-dependent oxidoreductase n=1 Tax=unclassified Actinoplanes TaxID=2626549 RepID=UPI0034470EED
MVVTYRKDPPPPGLLAVTCDVRDSESVDNCFTAAEELLGGPVGILISNAGAVADSLLLPMTEECFLEVVDANLAGAYRVARRATWGMLRARGDGWCSSPRWWR